MTGVVAQLVPMAETESNFLVPNATFFVELAAFALLFYLLAKYVIPPINRAMTNRQEAIRKEFADLDQARADANAAEAEFKAQIADARHEAARIREEAREQGAQIVSEMRQQGESEKARIIDGAHTQIAAERQQAVASLRAEVGTLATTLAGRIVGESLEDDERSGRVVDRFLADLDALETSRPRPAPAPARTGPADAPRRLSGGPRRAGVEGRLRHARGHRDAGRPAARGGRRAEVRAGAAAGLHGRLRGGRGQGGPGRQRVRRQGRRPDARPGQGGRPAALDQLP